MSWAVAPSAAAMLSDTVSTDDLDLDGFTSWESFYGSDNVELVESLLKMYDVLMGRSLTDGRIVGSKSVDWSAASDWNCRCSGKPIRNAITRCASCHTNIESDIQPLEVQESKLSSGEVGLSYQSVPTLTTIGDDKCELITCPAGFSTPTTPFQQRTFKRSEGNFIRVQRPLSVSSIASSSSSSSGTSSCSGARRIPHKSLVYLASIESLEDDSDSERQMQKNDSCGLALFKCNGSQGSEDSGVHSPCSYVSSPSPPQGRPKYCDPHLSYMDRVVMEIIETEEVYVRDLLKIIEGYLMVWRSRPNFPLSDRLGDLFGNIESIHSFNSLFLRELEQCRLDPVKVAQCFVRHNEGFSVYTEYCTNYPRTVSSLTELMRQEGTARLFRERQTALQHTLPLGSYLLKPVQRILKYHLLLENIVKQYSNGYEGYEDIQKALRTMTEIAQHINDMKRRHEDEVRVQEIQSLLYGWEGEDLTTFGELCAEGAFRMHGAKAPRQVFLFDKMVLITKEKEGGVLDYKTHINCSNLMLIESVPGEPLSFHVIPFDNPKHQYTLLARNLEQKREWTLQLKRVILENYDAVIPSHARQLVMELGQNRTNDEIMADKSLTRRQHSAPEYLEKRKQSRRNSETILKSKLKKIRKSDAGESLQSQYKNQRSLRLNGFEDLSESQSMPRRKSEPGMFSGKEEGNDLMRNVEEVEKSQKMEAEEMKTLEQVVAQILKQNAEFDKVLRRQQHSISIKKRMRKDGGGFDNCGLKLVPDIERPWKQKKAFQGNFRRSRSFQENDESIAMALANVSLDGENIPTSPSVWLRQQEPHLATPSNKAGSLPRSFQIGADSDPNRTKMSVERPFTIASDTVPSKMLLEDMYREKSRFAVRSDEDETLSLSTPGSSSDKINFHPDYKIYRSNLSTSLIKNVLTTVHNKLSKPETEKSKALQRERKANRIVWLLAKHYSKTLRQRHKRRSASVIEESAYKSPNIGERLANFSDVEWRVRPAKKIEPLNEKSGDVLLRRFDVDDPYERSFDAMDDEATKDDIVSSDAEFEQPREKVPPPVPAKPMIKPKEEEGDTSSQHSTASTVIEIQQEVRQKGWVRHVVGKLQGESSL